MSHVISAAQQICCDSVSVETVQTGKHIILDCHNNTADSLSSFCHFNLFACCCSCSISIIFSFWLFLRSLSRLVVNVAGACCASAVDQSCERLELHSCSCFIIQSMADVWWLMGLTLLHLKVRVGTLSNRVLWPSLP